MKFQEFEAQLRFLTSKLYGATLLKTGLAGGEDIYESLEEISREEAEAVYGYWIARLDGDTLELSEV